MPASVTALDENESHPVSGVIERLPPRITVEVRLESGRRYQYQKIDAALLCRRDPDLDGADRPGSEPGVGPSAPRLRR
jgi:hypothetical protein